MTQANATLPDREPLTVVVRSRTASKSFSVHGADDVDQLCQELIEDQLTVRRRTLTVDRRVVMPPTPTPA